jgi:hypothetical protein
VTPLNILEQSQMKKLKEENSNTIQVACITNDPRLDLSKADGLLVCSPATANTQANVGYCDSSGAQPSNTAPPNCIEGTTSILHTGIDSLYLYFSRYASPTNREGTRTA